MFQKWFHHFYRQAVLARLRAWRVGRLTIVDGSEVFHFGDSNESGSATLRVHAPGFYQRVACGGGLGAAEAFMDGDWSCDDLVGLIRLCIQNPAVATGLDGGVARWSQWVALWKHWLRRNNRANSQRNIHEHYDLGNEFFQLFLDETLNYSCGVFRDRNSEMLDASLEKMDSVCRKLDLRSDDEVLEIGTGWGALAAHIAQRYGCQVRTTTISREQASFARERMREQGMESLVTVDLKDYRDLEGTYDKLVSIEMIEAVGRQYLDGYFERCSRLLRPDGLMVLQGIVMRDQVAARHAAGVDFIGKYIFPGGFLPSVAEIGDSLARVTDLRVCDLEEMSPHYVRTLRAWRERFWDNIEDVRRLGFDNRFIRMWDYYLQYCEAAFAERQVNVVQLVLAKPRYQLPDDDACKTIRAGSSRRREESVR
ncbi:SAM-dependent methyltransferase [Anatilimnocola floriformis]|uniref:SAM-dependent methyltransferase n=1 Tax=Anatilimnocola floriformis TaxID=2948575 RepID=UPI0020C2BBA6|nr:cyclopropane-fatty-acyl-phospholipid synthase family protein [Anatilimnocola floriformis]